MSKVGEHLNHKTYVERDETVLEHAVDAHWTEGQSLLSHLPKKEGPVSYTHLTLPTTPYV